MQPAEGDWTPRPTSPGTVHGATPRTRKCDVVLCIGAVPSIIYSSFLLMGLGAPHLEKVVTEKRVPPKGWAPLTL